MSETMTELDFLERLMADVPRRRRAWYVLRRSAGKPKAWLRSVRYGWQRARRGYSDRDTWGFDAYLADVISGGVQQLREGNGGHPTHLTAEEWDDVLAQIVSGLQTSDWDGWPSDEQVEQAQQSLHLMADNFFHLWD